MADDQRVKAFAKLGPQALGVGGVLRRATPDAGSSRGALRREPLPVCQAVQAGHPFANSILIAHDRVAAQEDPRPLGD